MIFPIHIRMSLYTENANGMIQVTGQNSALTITLNGTGDSNSQLHSVHYM